MKLILNKQKRSGVLKNSLIMATTLLTCAGLQANDQQTSPSSAGAPGQAHSDKASSGQHGDKASKFVHEAAMGGQMEVQMGELGQQKAQNQQVKSLAAALVKDHTAANQKLQQIAQGKGLTLDKSLDQKHQKHLAMLKTQSGAEFDKAFVEHALKDHKKDIAKFEKFQKQMDDQQLKAFIDETLPKLRNHYQMAQSAARTLGIDESTLAVSVDSDDDLDTSAAGAAATSESSGSDTSRSLDKPRSSLDSSDNSSADLQANIGEKEFRADADLDHDSSGADATVRTDYDDNGNKIFQKGDNKVLGLSTDKNDGKFLGIIPNPNADKVDDSATATTTVDTSEDTAIGGPASTESGASASSITLNEAPAQVKQALRSEGITDTSNLKKMTVYEADVNGKKIHVTQDGKVYRHSDVSNP